MTSEAVSGPSASDGVVKSMSEEFRMGRRELLKGATGWVGMSLLPTAPSAEPDSNTAVRPYAKCITRMEYRGDDPPTKEYVDETLRMIEEAGIQAWWFSAVSQPGVPLFPSRAFPMHHPKASWEAFRYLIESAHQAGITMMSWHALGASKAITDIHPDWRMKFLDFPGTPNPEAAKRYACYNSPYRDLLYAFSKEIVKDLGFDGIWFDGSTFSNHATHPMFQPACCCDYCRERFQRDTGLEIPTKVDFDSRTFRLFLRWRYDVLMEVWRGVVEAAREANPQATVAFNNYRRRNSNVHLAWNTAIPLRRLDLDAVVSCELDGFYGQADIQMKICRALGGRKGLETWLVAADYDYRVPDVDPLNHVQAGLGCISGGGMLSVGVWEGDKASYKKEFFRSLRRAFEPRVPYVEGQPVAYAANLVSQQSMDYLGQNDPSDYWDAVHGVNELLQHAHLLSEVVFDDHVERGDVQEFPVLIVGNASCLSDAQAKKLTQYVEQGGALIACHQAGERDELGYMHARPVLDDLLGIRTRHGAPERACYEVLDPSLKVNESGFISAFGPHTKTTPVEGSRVFLRTHQRDEERTVATWPGAWMLSVGRGKVLYFDCDLFPSYLRRPTRSLREFFARLLTRLAAPPLTLRAPFLVTMNVRQAGSNDWWIHLHNCPGPGYRYPNPPRSRQLGPPGEVIPIGPITIEVSKGVVSSARSGVTGQEFKVPDGKTITIPRLEIHEVVVAALKWT